MAPAVALRPYKRALRAFQDLDALEIVEKPGRGVRTTDENAVHVEGDGGVGERVAGEVAGAAQVVDGNGCRAGGHLQRGHAAR